MGYAVIGVCSLLLYAFAAVLDPDPPPLALLRSAFPVFFAHACRYMSGSYYRQFFTTPRAEQSSQVHTPRTPHVATGPPKHGNLRSKLRLLLPSFIPLRDFIYDRAVPLRLRVMCISLSLSLSSFSPSPTPPHHPRPTPLSPIYV